jgi:hypothetical protein
MKIDDVVLGLAAGVGIDLSPDGKTAYYVEWSIGELSKVDTQTKGVTTIKTKLSYPEDVEVDWQTGDIFVSERTGTITRVGPGDRSDVVVTPGGAPQQLDLKKKGNKRILFTVCYDSGHLLTIDPDTRTIRKITSGLGHPVGLVVDSALKYAYVTEQDNKALTRVELANGKKTKLYSGLVSPFFLAWDPDEKGIFCIQRDPANSLVWLELGPPIQIKTVANGLAWRPSGVASDAKNKLIYTCADRELEVISFNGGPVFRIPKPPFEIYSIQFNHDGSKAIRLKDHLAGSAVPLPEYVKNVRNGPAAYIAGALPHIRVKLKKLPGYAAGAYAIGATGSLGGVRRKTVTPVFNASGISDSIDFELMWALPGAIGKPDVQLEWFTRKSPGPSIPVSMGSATHRLYLVIAKPTEPWVAELPWAGGLDLACGWAGGATSADAAAALIAKRYFECGVLAYDAAGGGGTRYGFVTFMLSEMIERLNGGTGLGLYVNCTDSADTVSTLSNLLGCDLWQSRMGLGFPLNPILAIGHPNANPWPTWSGFTYHEVAWKGACTQNDRLFDGCLMVDGDNDPTSAPYSWLLPVNILFGDCNAMNYRLRISPKCENNVNRLLKN